MKQRCDIAGPEPTPTTRDMWSMGHPQFHGRGDAKLLPAKGIQHSTSSSAIPSPVQVRRRNERAAGE